MNLDPNVDRMIETAIAPLIKRIKKLEAEVKKLKDKPPAVIYSDRRNIQ